MQRHHLTNESAIFSLWLNWAVSIVSLSLPTFIALFAPKIWIPIITLGIMFLLIIYRHTIGRSASTSCDLIETITIRSLGTSAVIMLVIAIAYVRGYISMFFEPSEINTDIPFLSILIIAPVTAFLTLYHIITDDKCSVCRSCAIKNGHYSERGFLGKVFRHESRVQLYVLFALTMTLTAIGWIYYAFFYINVSINGMDRFMLNWIPLIFYLSSLFYMGGRYFSFWSFYYKNIKLNPHRREKTSNVRFLIFSGEEILLSHTDELFEMQSEDILDTPCSLFIQKHETFSVEEAAVTFTDLTNISPADFTLRFMYQSRDISGLNNTFHFICCLNSPSLTAGSMLRGKWYSMNKLQRLIDERKITPLLAAELNRLYTITMAWKTYDSAGRRLYKVKNYRPGFRLKGICEWDVDFDSPKWLEIARFNEDKPFFRLRKLFRRPVNS